MEKLLFVVLILFSLASITESNNAKEIHFDYVSHLTQLFNSKSDTIAIELHHILAATAAKIEFLEIFRNISQMGYELSINGSHVVFTVLNEQPARLNQFPNLLHVSWKSKNIATHSEVAKQCKKKQDIFASGAKGLSSP